MTRIDSPYYPPRARWYSWLPNAASRWRRRLSLDRFRVPQGVSFWAFLGSLFVPGLGFYLSAPRFWGRVAMGAVALLLLVFFLGLGTTVGNLAFGLLLSLHVSGLTYLIRPWFVHASFQFRIFVSILLMIGLSLAYYLPIRNLIQEHWLLPLQVRGHTVVVRRMVSPAALHRGDWVAYSFPDQRGDGVVVRSGVGLGPILALPGDRIRFFPATFEINGVYRPRLPHMPTVGERVMPQNSWFVWPDFAIGGHGNTPESAVTATMMEMGSVTEDRVMGRPFRYWVWHRQFTR